ncbi:MAG TPA: hypothetical protein VJ436_11290, partial [Anaerolineales bacterium]|nr:hypothetical protein [Anaerolineales bacterium]
VKNNDPTGHFANPGNYVDESGRMYQDENLVDPTTPFQVGLEWLTGDDLKQHNFSEGDPFTKLLQKHSYIQEVRGKISQRLSEGDYNSYEQDYDLSGLKGVPKYARDYSTLLTAGTTGNLAVTFLGSYQLYYYVNKVDPENGTAEILFYVYNESTLASATHPPVIGYTDFWEQNITPFVNGLVAGDGPMSKVTQTILWTETISFP